MKQLFYDFLRGAYTIFTGDYSRPDDQPPDWREYFIGILSIIAVLIGILYTIFN